MDLLYSHVVKIPDNEILSGVYIVDGITMYASTRPQNESQQYNLYMVANHQIGSFIVSVNNLGQLDTIVSDRHFQVIEQSSRYENNIKIVNYITDRYRDKYVKKSMPEKIELTRYTDNRHKKLF